MKESGRMIRSEPPPAPELPPSPTTLPTRKSRKGLIIAVILIVIILGVVAITYVMADTNVASAIEGCTTTAGDYEITGFTLLPPSVDMEMNMIIRNPSDINLHLNEFQAEIFIEYGSNTCTLGNIDVSDKSLPAKGQISVPASIHAGATVVNFLVEHPTGYDIVVSGTVSITGQWLFWTITKEETETSREHA